MTTIKQQMQAISEELLIHLYKQRPMLWDKRLKEYKNYDLRVANLAEIAGILNISVSLLKRKIRSLRTSFCNEKRKCLKNKADNRVTLRLSRKYRALQFLEPVYTYLGGTDYENTNEAEESFANDDLSQFSTVDAESKSSTCLENYGFETVLDSDLKPLPGRKKRPEQQSIEFEKEDSLFEATPSFFRKPENVEEVNLVPQNTNSPTTSTFCRHLEYLLHDFPKDERDDFESDVLAQAYAKRKKIRIMLDTRKAS